MDNCPPSRYLISSSEEETKEYGIQLAQILRRGSIVALRGGLGVGKTYFTKGLAQGLGITEEVTSPTYTMINEYRGQNFPLYHIDAYRLRGDDDFSALGAEELLYGDGITVIEWSERISLPPDAITVEIEILEDGKRRIQITRQ
jgi:tRNA threonylcarbamoyladenosine biosynthesis protein TsaE